MSFFKDFKDDLSQAVNELGEGVSEKEESTVLGADDIPDMPADLAGLLGNVDDIVSELPEISEPAAEEPAEVFSSMVDTISEYDAKNEEPAEENSFSLNQDDLASMLDNIDNLVVADEVPEEEPEVVKEEVVADKKDLGDILASFEAPVAEPKVEPVFHEAPKVPEAEKIVAAPIFGNPNVIKEAPINTVKNINSMDTGVITKGMTINGDIVSNGCLDIVGCVKGNINVEGKLDVTGSIEGNSIAQEVFADGAKIIGEIRCNGSVKIGQSSVVRGNISASAAVLAGAIKGDIDVQGPVVLDSTAIIMGNIKSKSIQINNGAVIEGLCSQCYADVSPMSFFDDDKKAE